MRNSRPWSASVYSANAAPPDPITRVADFYAPGVWADFGDLARPFHAEHGTDAAGAAMRMALGHAEVGTVEAAGAHA